MKSKLNILLLLVVFLMGSYSVFGQTAVNHHNNKSRQAEQSINKHRSGGKNYQAVNHQNRGRNAGHYRVTDHNQYGVNNHRGPACGHRVNRLPKGYAKFQHHGSRYCWVDGVWYQPQGREYQVVMPPVGIVVNVLPAYHEVVYVDNHPYYYYHGAFYSGDRGRYEVVRPPIGVVIGWIPEGYRTMWINNVRYIELDGIIYMPLGRQGFQESYQVVGEVSME